MGSLVCDVTHGFSRTTLLFKKKGKENSKFKAFSHIHIDRD